MSFGISNLNIRFITFVPTHEYLNCFQEVFPRKMKTIHMQQGYNPKQQQYSHKTKFHKLFPEIMCNKKQLCQKGVKYFHTYAYVLKKYTAKIEFFIYSP